MAKCWSAEASTPRRSNDALSPAHVGRHCLLASFSHLSNGPPQDVLDTLPPTLIIFRLLKLSQIGLGTLAPLELIFGRHGRSLTF